MITEPKLEQRDQQHYVGIRTQVPMKAFKEVIPQLHSDLYTWLEKVGVAPIGAPFMRFHVINMEGNMDIEMGVPVASAVQGDDHVRPGVIPAGQYATLIYTGVSNGMKATRALLDWAADKGIVWDTYESERGDGFGSRIESYLTDPNEEPNQAKWETEIAIRLAA
jgi:effector-binding domain-containing protein